MSLDREAASPPLPPCAASYLLYVQWEGELFVSFYLPVEPMEAAVAELIPKELALSFPMQGSPW